MDTQLGGPCVEYRVWYAKRIVRRVRNIVPNQLVCMHNLMLIHFDKHKYVSSYCIGVMVGTVKLLASDGYLINTEL